MVSSPFAAAWGDEPLSPNEAWNRIMVLAREASIQRPAPGADKTAAVDQLAQLVNFANEFWQLYPDDPHVWEAKLVVLQATLQRADLEGTRPNIHLVESDVHEITDADSAPLPVRTEAAYWLLQLHAKAIADARDTSKLAALDAEVADYVRRYPQARQVTDSVWLRLSVYERVNREKADALLREFAKHPDPRIAVEAKRRVTMLDLTKKPLELKFTAVDGTEFDLAKWRGKVVVVDFWATWCGPCRVEVPSVVATYKKLHGKGLEIVGISLDSSKDKLLDFTKQKEMTWPQYFDGKTWDNKISGAFGIGAIPAVWLVDKRGYVRSTNARDDFEGQITKLLAE